MYIHIVQVLSKLSELFYSEISQRIVYCNQTAKTQFKRIVLRLIYKYDM